MMFFQPDGGVDGKALSFAVMLGVVGVFVTPIMKVVLLWLFKPVPRAKPTPDQRAQFRRVSEGQKPIR